MNVGPLTMIYGPPKAKLIDVIVTFVTKTCKGNNFKSLPLFGSLSCFVLLSMAFVIMSSLKNPKEVVIMLKYQSILATFELDL